MYEKGLPVFDSCINQTPQKSERPIKTNVNNIIIRHQAREDACGQVVIGFGFAYDWLGKWREFFKPRSVVEVFN